MSRVPRVSQGEGSLQRVLCLYEDGAKEIWRIKERREGHGETNHLTTLICFQN